MEPSFFVAQTQTTGPVDCERRLPAESRRKKFIGGMPRGWSSRQPAEQLTDCCLAGPQTHVPAICRPSPARPEHPLETGCDRSESGRKRQRHHKPDVERHLWRKAAAPPQAALERGPAGLAFDDQWRRPVSDRSHRRRTAPGGHLPTLTTVWTSAAHHLLSLLESQDLSTWVAGRHTAESCCRAR